MKRFLLTVLMMIAMMSLLFAAEAAGKKSGLFTYELKGNGTAVITKYDWKANKNEDVYIPRMIDGYMVTEIGESAFSNKAIVIKRESFFEENVFVGEEVVVVIPDTVTTIGKKAFYHNRITAITIPASVLKIEDGAFAGCVNVKNFSVDDRNPVYTTISGVLFNKIEKILVAFPIGTDRKSYTIPTGIVSVGPYAFYGMNGESTKGGFIFADSITSIGDYAFACSRFYGDGNNILPLGLTSIGNYAFYVSYGWDLRMNNKLESIGDYAFSETSVKFSSNAISLMLPDSIIRIGEGIFANYNSRGGTIRLERTKITEVPPYAFHNAYFTHMRLPDTLKIIRNNAFQGARVFVDIPASVEHIEDEAFYCGDGHINFDDGSKLKTLGNRVFNTYHFNGQGTLTLPVGLEEIGAEVFNKATDLDLIVIPASVKKIGKNLCDRGQVVLRVERDSYAALYASENGYQTEKAGGDDTSWLNN